MTGALRLASIARTAFLSKFRRSRIWRGLLWRGDGQIWMKRARIFQQLRSEEGERLVLDENSFVEHVLPKGILRKLNDEEMSWYRARYSTREARLPTLVWPRELPIGGVPGDVTAIVERYGAWLSRRGIPKLLIVGDRGVIGTGRSLEFCRTWPNQREVTVRGSHFLQEDSPDEIGAALREFVQSVRGC